MVLVLLYGRGVDEYVIQVNMDESRDEITEHRVINLWKVEGALQSPCCITWLTNVPNMVAKAVFGTSSLHMCIFPYTSDMSNLDLYVA